MIEWKIGDEVWLFKTESYHSEPQIPSDIYLVNGVIDGLDDEDYIEIQDNFLNTTDLHKCYRTKNDAIDDMIKRLEELRSKND